VILLIDVLVLFYR